MKKYMKAFISFLIGAVCILIGLNMQTDNQLIIYFLYIVGLINVYIGVKDVIAISKGSNE